MRIHFNCLIIIIVAVCIPLAGESLLPKRSGRRCPPSSSYYVVAVVVVVERRGGGECVVAFRPHFLETLEKLVHHFDRRWSCWAVARPSVSIRFVTLFLSRTNGDTHTHTHTLNIIQEMEDREREREMRARDVERDGRHRVESNPPPLSTRRRQPAQSGVSRETAAIHIEAHIDRERERGRALAASCSAQRRKQPSISSSSSSSSSSEDRERERERENNKRGRHNSPEKKKKTRQ